MTVLHSAINFIEENLPSYYESKDKKNPLKENLTPQFNVDDLIYQSPRSHEMSLLMSRLGGNDKSYVSSDREERNLSTEEMLFKLENENLPPFDIKNRDQSSS